MAAQKKYDIVIKGGEYQVNGETKARWVNLGAVMQGDNGPFILLDPGVNLAAYMEPGKDRVIASLFEPKPHGQQQQAPQRQAPQQAAPQQGAPQQQVTGGGMDGFEDEIPFN